jgi:hypothetical protein
MRFVTIEVMLDETTDIDDDAELTTLFETLNHSKFLYVEEFYERSQLPLAWDEMHGIDVSTL